MASRGPSWGQGLLAKLLAGFTITSLEQKQAEKQTTTGETWAYIYLRPRMTC